MGKKNKAKGKANGRAGQRMKTQKKTSPKFTPWALESDDDNSGRAFRGFAQKSNAPNVPYELNISLRHRAIAFVSAGSKTPNESDPELKARAVASKGEDEDSGEEEEEDEEDNEDEDEDIEDNDYNIQTNILEISKATEIEFSQGAIGRMSIHSPASPVQPLFVVDTKGDPSLAAQATAKGKTPAPRSPSPIPSDSDSEVVVFHGRNKQTISASSTNGHTAEATAPTAPPTQSPQATIQPAPDHELPQTPLPPPPSVDDRIQAKGWASSHPLNREMQKQQQAAGDPWVPAPDYPYWRKGAPRPDPNPPPEVSVTESAPKQEETVQLAHPAEELDAETSIAKLQAEVRNIRRRKKQARATVEALPEIDLGKSPSRRGKRGRKRDNRVQRQMINSDEEDDAADEAAYIDYMENLKAQLDREGGSLDDLAMHPTSGPSMVVDGREIAEDMVLTEQDWEDEDSSEASERPIGQDVDDLSDSELLDLSDLDSSELEDAIEYTEREQWEDEEDLRQRRRERMTDEQIARLFAKQQELGIDAEDLVIDDGYYGEADDMGDVDGVGDISEAQAGLLQISTFTSKRRSRGAKRSNGSMAFPDASALADTVEQYGEHGFDIMDFERPSLRNTKKGRKGKLPPELEGMSDEELKEEMRSTWEKDREKKRQHKAGRQELREQGLLGAAGRTGKADLGQKYLEGMTMKQVKDELRFFLQATEQSSRAFPPMAKADRAALHSVAQTLGLNSKSVGSGKNRFPVLYRTSHTVVYSEGALNRAFDAAERGFFRNQARKGKKNANGMAKTKGPGGGGRGGFNAAAVSLRNGEVVGAGAKELGKENFGHRLMEKMGWTAGTGLGKDRDGLILPVEQVMRAGRSGLG